MFIFIAHFVFLFFGTSEFIVFYIEYNVVLPLVIQSYTWLVIRIVRWLVQFRGSFGRRTPVSSGAGLIVEIFLFKVSILFIGGFPDHYLLYW